MHHKSRTTVLMTPQDILHLLLLGIICTTPVVSSNLFLYFLSSSAYPTAQVLLPHNSDTIRKKLISRSTLGENSYCQVFMVPRSIITGFGLDDWIYWRLLVQSLLNTMDYITVLSWLLRTRSILILDYDSLLICDCTNYIASRRIHRKHRLPSNEYMRTT
jgi:hypothetical protein